MGRLLADEACLCLQGGVEDDDAFAQHQPVFGAAEAEDVDAAVGGQRPERHAQGGAGVGQARSVHVNVQPVTVSEGGERLQFVGFVDGAQLGALGEVDGSRLRVVLFAEVAQVGADEFRGQFAVGGGYRADLASCHSGRRAAFVHVDVRRLCAEYQVVGAGA